MKNDKAMVVREKKNESDRSLRGGLKRGGGCEGVEGVV